MRHPFPRIQGYRRIGGGSCQRRQEKVTICLSQHPTHIALRSDEIPDGKMKHAEARIVDGG
jgi:hypothetical protein